MSRTPFGTLITPASSWHEDHLDTGRLASYMGAFGNHVTLGCYNGLFYLYYKPQLDDSIILASDPVLGEALFARAKVRLAELRAKPEDNHHA